MPWFFNLFLGSFVVVGLLVAGFGARNAWRDRASVDWPKAPGEMLQSTVEVNSDSDGPSYKPKVEYRYRVNDRSLVGKRISFGVDGGVGGRVNAERYVAKYPAGADVTVHYRADQPELSVLEPGLTKRSFAGLAFGGGFALFALWFRLIFWLMT